MIKTYAFQVSMYMEAMVELEQEGESKAAQYAEKLMLRFHLNLNDEQLAIYHSMPNYRTKSIYVNQLIK